MKINKNTIITIALFFILSVTILFLINKINNLKYDLNISEHNFEAAKSEINVFKLRNKEIVAQKDALILSEENMLKELNISKSQIKELTKKLGSQAEYISKIESEIKIDSMSTKKDSIIYVNGEIGSVAFNMNDKWLSFDGISDLKKNSTTIFNVKIPVPVKIGISENYSIFVTSENPYLNITDINAVAIDDFVKKAKKKPHWGFGIYGGFGVQYDLFNKNFGAGPQIGFGAFYIF